MWQLGGLVFGVQPQGIGTASALLFAHELFSDVCVRALSL